MPVAQGRQIVGPGEQLRMTQPAMLRADSWFECPAGGRLFWRLPNGVHLTAHSTVVPAHARQFLCGFEDT